jgi:hypothetical protein
MPPFLIKPLLFLLVFTAAGGYGYYKGAQNTRETYEAAAAIQARENAEKLAAIILETETKTRALQNELRKAKAGNTLPDRATTLSTDFCRMYNADAGLPESPCPAPVTVEAIADTTRDNFAACRQNAIWLEECQSICGH